jgi:hypothetical protein
MVEGPNAVYICALCIDVAAKLVDGERKGGTIRPQPKPDAFPPEIHGATEH